MKSNQYSDTYVGITQAESLALRGVCISLVVLHNLIHNVVPFHENEKWFNQVNADFFIHNVADHPLLGILSYAGWMGVPIFFFFCGYGLTIKYGDMIPSKLQFIKRHYLKLLFIFGPIVVANGILIHMPLSEILGELTFLNNIVDFNHRILPAAFWYVRCAFEFYLLYALILYKANPKYMLILGLIVCLLLMFLDGMAVRAIKLHSIGWLMDFSLGCYIATTPSVLRHIENKMAGLLLMILLAFSIIQQQMWVISDVLIILFLLSIRRYLTNKIFLFIGTISAFLYATHPIIRTFWHWELDYMNGNVFMITMSIGLYFIVCIIVATLYRSCYIKFESYINKIFNKKEC